MIPLLKRGGIGPPKLLLSSLPREVVSRRLAALFAIYLAFIAKFELCDGEFGFFVISDFSLGDEAWREEQLDVFSRIFFTVL